MLVGSRIGTPDIINSDIVDDSANLARRMIGLRCGFRQLFYGLPIERVQESFVWRAMDFMEISMFIWEKEDNSVANNR